MRAWHLSDSDSAIDPRQVRALGLVVAMSQLVLGRSVAQVLDAHRQVRILAITDSLDRTLTAVTRLEPDVLVCDGRMPGIVDLLREIRATSLDTASVVLGTPNEAESPRQLFSAGAIGYVSSSASICELMEAIVYAALGSSIVPTTSRSSLVMTPTAIRTWTRGQRAPVLTPRESDVVALLARGLTNPEIAAELQVSRSTVKTHVHSVLIKLGVKRRGEVATHVAATEADSAAPRDRQ